MIKQEVIAEMKRFGFSRSPVPGDQERFSLDLDFYGDNGKSQHYRIYLSINDDAKYWDVPDESRIIGICCACMSRAYKIEHAGPLSVVSEWTIHPCSIVTQRQLKDVIMGVVNHGSSQLFTARAMKKGK
jgi:hypothetical protein